MEDIFKTDYVISTIRDAMIDTCLSLKKTIIIYYLRGVLCAHSSHLSALGMIQYRPKNAKNYFNGFQSSP